MNETKSLFVELPPEEARRRWESSSPALRRVLLAIPGREVRLHFIPALGGCVIAAIPSAPERAEKPVKASLHLPVLRASKPDLDKLLESLHAALTQPEPQPLSFETASRT